MPQTTRLLYAQLLELCLAGQAPSSRGVSFVTKQVRGNTYWYMQVTVGARKLQQYVGPDTPDVRQAVRAEKQLTDSHEPARRDRLRLVAMLARGGAYTLPASESRVFELLERAGLFAAGAVVVGSHAFLAYGNMLGARWETEAARTADIDSGAVPLAIADRPVDLPQLLADSGLGFLPVPALDRKHPSTSFKIRGRELIVDLLTPLRGTPRRRPVALPWLGAFATPVRYLDYLLDEAQPAALLGGAGVLVNVPNPARYALHKLALSRMRPAAWHTKAAKDIDQAKQIIDVLLDERPHDLTSAWEGARNMPQKFTSLVQQSVAALKPVTLREALAQHLD
jgi:hypothetical protein